LLAGIIALAHRLDMEVICEGVETLEQKTLVSQSECDFIQGWYYAKAMPVEDCKGFMEEHLSKYN
jgi:EAL domain-containing protein (putative c-di-GMP-specific phosphodiesterase class I)